MLYRYYVNNYNLWVLIFPRSWINEFWELLRPLNWRHDYLYSSVGCLWPTVGRGGKPWAWGSLPRAPKIRLRFNISVKFWEISQKSTILGMSRTIVVLASKNRFLGNSPGVFWKGFPDCPRGCPGSRGLAHSANFCKKQKKIAHTCVETIRCGLGARRHSQD